MGVFDGGTYCVTVYRNDPDDGDDEYTDDPRELVERLRQDPSVKAVETHAVHYVTGNYQSEFSFGNRYEEED